MEKLPATGKAKAIGVANLSKSYLQRLLLKAEITPAANQIENHPLLPQQEIVDFCKEHGILVTAYSPLGSTGSPLFKEEEVVKIADKHGVGPGTVLLSWHFARGSSVIPKSVTPSRIDENRTLIDLDSSDVEALDGISKSKGLTRYVFPPFGVSS
jgi:glycerol 2-dehydrogenase (NADP+)